MRNCLRAPDAIPSPLRFNPEAILLISDPAQ